MFSLEQVRAKSKRANFDRNKRLHFFAARMSVYFSWFFVNTGISANHVTALFFLVGLCAALVILRNNVVCVIVSYLLFRIHIILDVSDGEVVRFTEKYSRNGSYWDYLTHSLVYPLYFGNMGIASYLRYHDVIFLLLAVFGAISIGFFDSVKNDYYRSVFVNNISKEEYDKQKLKAKNGGKLLSHVHPLFLNIFSFEGLLLFYVMIYFIDEPKFSFYLLLSYVLIFLGMAVLKVYLLSYKGDYPHRN